MRIIVDSYAWIEYFLGSGKGAAAKKIIENKSNEILTADVCLAEIRFWSLQEKIDFEKLKSIILSNSSIVESGLDDWLEAAEIKFEKRRKHKNIGLVDCLVMGKQRQLNAFVLTGDAHFKDNQNTKLI